MRVLIYAFIWHVRKRFFLSLFVSQFQWFDCAYRAIEMVTLFGLAVCMYVLWCSSSKAHEHEQWIKCLICILVLLLQRLVVEINRIVRSHGPIHTDCTRLETNDKNMRCVSTHVRYVCLELFWLWIYPSGSCGPLRCVNVKCEVLRKIPGRLSRKYFPRSQLQVAMPNCWAICRTMDVCMCVL